MIVYMFARSQLRLKRGESCRIAAFVCVATTAMYSFGNAAIVAMSCAFEACVLGVAYYVDRQRTAISKLSYF